MSRFSRPYTSLQLYTEEVNEQVPEMSITGFGRREIPAEVGPRLVVPYQLISTHEIDFPDDFVQPARPTLCREDRSLVSPSLLESFTARPSLCREDRSLVSPSLSENLTARPSSCGAVKSVFSLNLPENLARPVVYREGDTHRSHVLLPSLPESSASLQFVETGLNETHSEDDLKKLLECSQVRSAVRDKKSRKRVKTVDTSTTYCEDKLEDSRKIYDDVEEPFQETVVLYKKGRLIDLFEEKANHINLQEDKRYEAVQYVTLVYIVPNAAEIVLELGRISSKWDSESKLESCMLHSESYMPRSFNPIILQFPGVNLIKDHDLCRNYVFYHVILQRFNEDRDSDDFMAGTKALCSQSNHEEEPELIPKPSIHHSDEYDSSCFLFGNSCSKGDFLLESGINLDHGSKISTSPNKRGRSKVRSSRTFTKVVHNWWEPTPPKKIKRYLSPDSFTAEKASTSGSEMYWDFYDISTGQDRAKDNVMRKFSLTNFKPKTGQALSPECSESSSDKFDKQDPKSKDSQFNYYTLCPAPRESLYEFVDLEDSFDEDSLNESNGSSVSLEEVRWNNEVYYVPSSSKQCSQDIGTRDFLVQNEKLQEKLHYPGRIIEYSTATGANSDKSEYTSRMYSEETTTIFEVGAHSSESSSVCFHSSNTCTHRGQCIAQNSYRPLVTSWSIDRAQISTKNQIEFSDKLFYAQGSSEPDYKHHRSKLPPINNVEAKCYKAAGVSMNNKISSKPLVSNGSSQSSVDSSFSNVKFLSKLPILQRKPPQVSQAKKPHWTAKASSKYRDRPPEITSERLNNPSELKKMRENLRLFAKAPVRKDKLLSNHPRKLSPIAASESMSCSKSFDSERSTGHGNVYTSFFNDNVYELEELSNESDSDFCPYEMEINPPDIGGYVRPERSAFLTCRIPKERTFTNRFILPDISVGRRDNSRRESYKHRGSRCEQRMKFPNAVKEVVSRISTKKNNNSEREPYDLYKSAEEQMMKLLEPEKSKEVPKPVSTPETPSTPTSPPLSPPMFSSDNSAFSKFPSTQSPSPLFITEDDNANEADCKSHSEKSDSPLTITYSDNGSRKDSNENPITLSTLSLCSSVSIESVDSNKNGYRMAFAANSAKEKKAPLRRSVSAFESRKEAPSRKNSKGRDPSKNRLKMEDMLYGSSNLEGERYFDNESINSFLQGSADSLGKPVSDFDKLVSDFDKPVSSFEKPVSDLESLNSAEQELLKSMSEFEKVFCSTSSSPDQSSQPIKIPSLLSSFPIGPTDRFPDIELQPAHLGTNGSDSAYSSLNRKSPVGGSGDGEGSARFCHECGAKYPLAVAKFCCQCGVRRLIL